MSVLTAPLAQIDRRTLSQAWYSALQLSNPHRQASPRPAGNARHVGGRPVPMRGTQSSAGLSRLPALPPHPMVRSENVATESPGSDRRAARSSLARRIERQFLHPMKRPTSATLRLSDGSRCRVSLLQRDGIVHLIVVIPARHARDVRAALDQARFALARSGVSIRCELHASEVSDVD